MATATSDFGPAVLEEPAPRGPIVGHVVTNETPGTLELETRDHALLVLHPFEPTQVSPEKLAKFKLEDLGDIVSVRPIHGKQTGGEPRGALLVAVGYSFMFSVAWGILAAFVGAPQWWIFGWVGLAVALLVAWAVDWVRTQRKHQQAGAETTGLTVVKSVSGQSLRWFGQQFYLMTSLLIGIALPGAAIFFAADGLDLYRELRDAPVGTDHHAVVLTVIGRIMQLVFVAIAALLPALLYFLFDREHLQTLQTRFVRQIMRFDPTVPTRPAVRAKYQKLMEEAYGRSGRILPGRRSPILLASLVIALGWTFTLLHGDVHVIDERGITALFEPRQSAVAFAFLGAYFFGINAILRGYVRRDLRPKTYSTLTVRVIVVVILAWVVELQWHDATLFVLAFLFGIVPDTALVLLKESVRAFGSRFTDVNEEQDPLTCLEGIDLYDRARLFEEGVTNIESLAHHDVIDLMLQTRVPGPRLVDWLDQAILYLHAGPREQAGDHVDRAASLNLLRAYGIRTATDLENAVEAAQKDQDLKRVLDALGPEDAVSRIAVISKTIADEEWMANLRHWHDPANAIPKPRRVPVPS